MDHCKKIPTVNFQLDLDPDCSLAISMILYAFAEKKKRSYNHLCSVTRCIIVFKNDFIFTKKIFNLWNIKIIQDFNVYMCSDCWSNDCHLPHSFKWYVTSNHKWEINWFLQIVIFLYFIWTLSEINSFTISLANSDSWFFNEYHFHPIVLTLWLFLFSPLKTHFIIFAC